MSPPKTPAEAVMSVFAANQVKFPAFEDLQKYLEEKLIIAKTSPDQRKSIIAKTAQVFAGALKSLKEIDDTVFLMLRTINDSLKLSPMQLQVINLLIGHLLKQVR